MRRLLIPAVLLLVSCDGPRPGDGPHEYKSTQGKATIRSMSVEQGTRTVTFDFRPDDPAAGGAQDGATTAWPRDREVKAGDVLRCVRKDRTQGTTSPLVWEFP